MSNIKVLMNSIIIPIQNNIDHAMDSKTTRLNFSLMSKCQNENLFCTKDTSITIISL